MSVNVEKTQFTGFMEKRDSHVLLQTWVLHGRNPTQHALAFKCRVKEAGVVPHSGTLFVSCVERKSFLADPFSPE